MGEKKEFSIYVVRFMIAAIAVLLATLVLVFGFIWGKRNHEMGKEENKEEIIELELVYAYQNAQWNEAIEQTVANFNEAYPNIQVSYQIHYENTVYENILNKLIARDQLGDVVQIKTPKAYVNSGILGTISEDLVEELEINYTYTMKEFIYGVGAVRATNGIIYNKEIFERFDLEEPKTYEEFLDLCTKLKMHRITPVGVGGSDLWHMEYWVNHFFRSDVLYQNPSWMKQCAKGEANWMDQEIARMLQHLEDLFSNGRVDQNWLSTTDGSMAYMFSEGEFAMMYTSACNTEAILQLHPEMQLGWFYVPDDTGEVQVDEINDTYWSISSKCQEDAKKYEAAMTFLKFFYSAENYANVRKSITAFSAIDGAEDYSMNDIQAQIAKDYREQKVHITGYIGDEDCPEGFEIMMLTILQEMLKGELSVEEAQMLIQEAWEKCLGKEVEP